MRQRSVKQQAGTHLSGNCEREKGRKIPPFSSALPFAPPSTCPIHSYLIFVMNGRRWAVEAVCRSSPPDAASCRCALIRCNYKRRNFLRHIEGNIYRGSDKSCRAIRGHKFVSARRGAASGEGRSRFPVLEGYKQESKHRSTWPDN
ncbi:hypothetical protein E2C01_021502 [Portunus trituberculatus]|uniref:Uncharacterized protein n=1 Tax=Portunus trituberculatus TaxID=210409 RepID=A0A5B7E2S2_PORTR|nr:hypothetical protein [Portunus trituberculatus]